jgi:hypothetical protein
MDGSPGMELLLPLFYIAAVPLGSVRSDRTVTDWDWRDTWINTY